VALAFEAPVGLHLDILFTGSAASAHRREFATERCAPAMQTAVLAVDESFKCFR
jgi:hypothetical protein